MTTHSDIVPAALAGRTLANYSFSTEHKRRPGRGYLSRALHDVLSARYYAGAVTQVIYSYATPIAWLDGDAWVIPNVKYSATTSCKHATHLYKLPNRVSVNWDTPMNEYLRVIAGLMVYTDKGTSPGESA